MSAEPETSSMAPLGRRLTILLAALAAIAIDQATAEPDAGRLPRLGITLVLVIAPAVAASSWLDRRPEIVRSAALRAVALLGLFLLPFAVAGLVHLATGRRAMPEILLLLGLRNLGLGLAALGGGHASLAKLSALVALFAATTASAVGGEAGPSVLLPLAGFAVVGTSWLALVHRDGLGPKATTAVTATRSVAPRRTSLAGLACIASLLAAVGLVGWYGPPRASTALAGWLPTSGGTEGSDPESRSGVGDGDNEVAASKNPRSVGFTDSQIYLETDRPSLYDAVNEAYGEPFQKEKFEKMIAIGPQNVTEQKERPAENLRAGREFSAVRKPPEPTGRRPEERGVKALIYVQGPTPAHLPLEAFAHFDGSNWREEGECDIPFPAEVEPGGGWLRLPPSLAPFLAGTVRHRVKIGTLDSSPMPVPPHLCRFRVGSVDRLDFFGWAQRGVVRMRDRSVPAGTVIDTEARTVDPQRLREVAFPRRSADDRSHYVSFLELYRVDPRVVTLARAWTEGVPEGWAQVEAIVAGLRAHAVHDRSATASEGCADVVAEFLCETRRGPDYLFASAAVVMLRALGYPARLVSGLYVDPAGYDARTRHTLVSIEHVHTWAEVQLPNMLWMDAEPTPGYGLMPPKLSWPERIAEMAVAAGRWAANHWIVLAMGLALGVGAVLRRAVLAERLATLTYHARPSRDLRRLVLRTVRLVEFRARLAGRARSPGTTLRRWSEPLGADPELARLVRLAGWAAHAPAGTTADDVTEACRRAARTWTLARFRAATPESSREAIPT